MSIAVLCPTRGRPDTCSYMIRSVIDSSEAHVLIYMDEDDETRPPLGSWNSPRVKVETGPRIGPVASCNRLVELYPDYDLYGIITDDSIVTTPGWDDWAEQVLRHAPGRICVISPHHSYGDHVDMPFVTKEWIKATGWYACPDCYHYSWPTVTGLIGEMSAIVHAPEHKFSITHDYIEGTYPERRSRDALAFYDFMSLKLPQVVERVRKAMS